MLRRPVLCLYQCRASRLGEKLTKINEARAAQKMTSEVVYLEKLSKVFYK